MPGRLGERLDPLGYDLELDEPLALPKLDAQRPRFPVA